VSASGDVALECEFTLRRIWANRGHRGIGAVGYVYDQLEADHGSAPILGPVKSRVFGVGSQLGFIFPVAGMQGYLNLKGYGEFDNHDRPAGWNTWLTFAISPAPPPAATPMSSRPMYTK
jgi:hypothetical protein